MYRDFFWRPTWQQYGFIFITVFLLFVVAYLSFIDDVEYQAQQQQNLYQQKSVEIERLQAKMIRYEDNQQQRLTLISENELANSIERCHLSLQSFKYSEIGDVIYWDIELHGQFSDFITLISSFIDDDYYLDFQQLVIRKQDSQLNIKFTLLFNRVKR